MRAPTHDLFEYPPVPEAADTADDRMAERDHVWRTFVQIGLDGIAAANKLSVEQNEELFDTPALDRVIELILTSLSRLAAQQPRGAQ
jgi:hypothetical protein